MAEALANHAVTRVAAAGIDALATTLRVAHAVGFPTSGTFAIMIDPGKPNEEIMKVVGGHGTTWWTVLRAAEPTSGRQEAFPHAADAVVAHVLTAGSLQAWLQTAHHTLHGNTIGKDAGHNTLFDLTHHNAASDLARRNLRLLPDPIRDYGAKGDGVTDDGQALQRWLDSGERVLRLPAPPGGAYRTGRTLVVPPSTTVLGDSHTRTYVKRIAGAFAGPLLTDGGNATGIVLDSLSLDNDGAKYDVIQLGYGKYQFNFLARLSNLRAMNAGPGGAGINVRSNVAFGANLWAEACDVGIRLAGTTFYGRLLNAENCASIGLDVQGSENFLLGVQVEGAPRGPINLGTRGGVAAAQNRLADIWMNLSAPVEDAVRISHGARNQILLMVLAGVPPRNAVNWVGVDAVTHASLGSGVLPSYVQAESGQIVHGDASGSNNVGLDLRRCTISLSPQGRVLNGASAGRMLWVQDFVGTWKHWIGHLDGYRNGTHSPQVVAFPTPFVYVPGIVQQPPGLRAHVSATELTLPADMHERVSGVIEVSGI